MRNRTEHLVLPLTKLEKEYIQECAQKKCLSIEQFLVLCALSFQGDQGKSSNDRSA